MREIVLDASVVIKWFSLADESNLDQARAIRVEYERGDSVVVVPSLLFLEILNVAGRVWRWKDSALIQFAQSLDQLAFDISEPDISATASWVAKGLTAYDAAYVALAEDRDVPLISDDALIIAIAKDIAVPLSRI